MTEQMSRHDIMYVEKLIYFYYICNYTTYVTLNDAVVAHLYPSSVIFYHGAIVKEYSKNIYIPNLNFEINTLLKKAQ
jgi:hypothetical protein